LQRSQARRCPCDQIVLGIESAAPELTKRRAAARARELFELPFGYGKTALLQKMGCGVTLVVLRGVHV